MFKSKLLTFNESFKYQNRTDWDLGIISAKKIIDDHWDEFYEQLETRQVIQKIIFMDHHILPQVNQISEFKIQQNKLNIKLSNLLYVIRIKKIQWLIETYFLVKPSDELFNLLCFYFLEEKNLIKITLFDYFS